MGTTSVQPPTTRKPGIYRIPLKAADGSVKAYAHVSSTDFEWVNRWSWSLLRSGYVMRSQKRAGKRLTIYLHRAILGLEKGDGLVADHINRDRLDNRRTNLRTLTPLSSPQNRSGYGRSSYRGVRRYGGRWLARVEHPKGTVHSLGSFGAEVDAAAVAAQWRHKNMPAAVEAPALLARVVKRDHPRNPRAGLADSSVIDIRRGFLAGKSRYELAAGLQLPYPLVCSALAGRSYKDLPLLAEVSEAMATA
jgi:hypothetical protein